MSCKIDFINNWELKYQGAESRLYFGLHEGNRCVMKHRFSKKYRHNLLDKKLTKERTKRERRIIDKIRNKSKMLGPYMPKVVWSDDSTILMTEIQGCEPLYDIFERQPAETTNLAPLIAQCIAELHNLGIIHGDLTTANLLLVQKIKKTKSDVEDSPHIVIPIDFGLSTGSMHPEEKAVDLHVLERALLSTHFSDSTFFNSILENYLKYIDQAECRQKIIEKFQDVRARGRKTE